jgi:hypothetical protein
MLYFTESGDASEDPLTLNEQFEAQYDTVEYEKKVSRLMAHAYRRIKRESPEKLRLWNTAFRVLRKGDDYILVFWEEPILSRSWRGWTPYIFGALAAASLSLLVRFFFGFRRNLLRGEPAPIEKYIPTLSPPAQHVLQFLFLLIILYGFFPRLFSKFASICWPGPKSNSARKKQGE